MDYEGQDINKSLGNTMQRKYNLWDIYINNILIVPI